MKLSGLNRRTFLGSLGAASALAACSSGASVPTPGGGISSGISSTSSDFIPGLDDGLAELDSQSTSRSAAAASTSFVPLTIIVRKAGMTPCKNINIYIYGQTPGTFGLNTRYQCVTTASGTLAPLASSTAGVPGSTNTVPAIPFFASPSTSPDLYTSQTISLPQLNSARLYISFGPLAVPLAVPNGLAAYVGPSGPAPWSGDATASQYFDFVEYSWTPGASFDVDTSQVDAFSLAIAMALRGQQGLQHRGFKASAVSAVYNILKQQMPWNILASQFTPGAAGSFRILNPQHGFPSNVAFPLPSTFLDAQMVTIWNSFLVVSSGTQNWMTVDLSSAGFPTLYGVVDPTTMNFMFFTGSGGPPQSVPSAGSAYATIPSPFSQANQMQYNWFSATGQMLSNNGAFLAPAVFPGNATNAAAAQKVGDYLAGALNRGTLPSSAKQEDCAITDMYPTPTSSGPTQNVFAMALHAVSGMSQYGYPIPAPVPPSSNAGVNYGPSYAFSFDDSCSLSTNITDPQPTSVKVLISPS